MPHPQPSLRRRCLRWGMRTLVTTFFIASAYILGFASFVVFLPDPFTTLPENLDGLATFTGGSGRVDAALKEVQYGFEGPILISGSHKQTRLTDILAQTSADLTPTQTTRIVYDTAETTRENIVSLKLWASVNNVKHLGLVTSTYHVPRVSLLAFFHAPELTITYLPVQPADPGLRPLFREYNKLLVAPFLQ